MLYRPNRKTLAVRFYCERAGNTHDVDGSVTADTDTNWMLIRTNYCSVHVVKLSTLCTGVIV